MEISEYRKQYEEQLKQAADQQISNEEFLNSFKEGAEESVSNSERSLVSNATTANKQDEINQIVNIGRDKNANTQIRIDALARITNEIGERQDLIDVLLNLLQDVSEPPELRRATLKSLQQLSFHGPAFLPKRPEYLAILRSVIEDKDVTLRRLALGTLAREKDEYVQRRLIEGLETPFRALVEPAKAIQWLGYDIHASYYPLLKQIVEKPPSLAAKVEAVRLLAAEPSSKDLLIGMLNNKAENRKVRIISATALQSLDPAEFENQAKRIILDDQEDNQLRTMCMVALTHFANPASLRKDNQFDQGIEELEKTATSRPLKKATRQYRLNK